MLSFSLMLLFSDLEEVLDIVVHLLEMNIMYSNNEAIVTTNIPLTLFRLQ